MNLEEMRGLRWIYGNFMRGDKTMQDGYVPVTANAL